MNGQDLKVILLSNQCFVDYELWFYEDNTAIFLVLPFSGWSHPRDQWPNVVWPSLYLLETEHMIVVVRANPGKNVLFESRESPCVYRDDCWCRPWKKSVVVTQQVNLLWGRGLHYICSGIVDDKVLAVFAESLKSDKGCVVNWPWLLWKFTNNAWIHLPELSENFQWFRCYLIETKQTLWLSTMGRLLWNTFFFPFLMSVGEDLLLLVWLY